MIRGGSKLSEARVKERELVETKRKLVESEQKQTQFMKGLSAMVEDEEYLGTQFGAIQEEISDTTVKLKTLWNKYQSKTAELKDLEEENVVEEQELSENIKALTRQFQLKSVILEYFIPSKWLEFIEDHSQWDPSIDQWRIPALEYSGNNMAPQRLMDDGTHGIMDDGVGLKTERPLTERRMRQIWKRVKALSGEEESETERMGYSDLMMRGMDMDSDDDDEATELAPEIQEAIHVAMNTNIDPNQNGEKVYLTYGVDLQSIKKKSKSRKKK